MIRSRKKSEKGRGERSTLTLADEIVAPVLEMSNPTHHWSEPLWIVRTTPLPVVVEDAEAELDDEVTEAEVDDEVTEAEVEDEVTLPEADNNVSNLLSLFPSLSSLYIQHEMVGVVEDRKPAWLEAW